MQPEVLWFGLNPDEWTAIATVTNAVLVIALAVINFLYMRSAAQQAKAATKQAAAAEKQTEAALENITLLKNQLHDQELLKRIETVIDLRRLRSALSWWSPKLIESWGALPTYERFLPDNWPSMVFVIQRALPNQKQNLVDIEAHIRNADTLVVTELAKPPTSRQPDVLRAASMDLDAASRPIREILSA